MDLRELDQGSTTRHPWELARVAALCRILSEPAAATSRLLDVGCGDAFAARVIQDRLGASTVVGLDIHLSGEQAAELATERPGLTLLTSWEQLGAEERFDLALLLDVIEHVADDEGLVRRVVDGHLCPGGYVLITVPAFQRLFSAHDEFLGHYRRYRRGQLVGLARRVGLDVRDSGHLFASLLLPRALSVLAQRVAPRGQRTESKGVGGWTGGPLLSRVLELGLNADNLLLRWLQRWHLMVPGLSVWALCQKPI